MPPDTNSDREAPVPCWGLFTATVLQSVTLPANLWRLQRQLGPVIVSRNALMVAGPFSCS
jgi:hypothetical protein